MKKIVRIYSDVGASPTCTIQLQKTLMKLLSPNYEVTLVSAADIQRGEWKGNTSLLCFGGGYDLGYIETLSTAGTTHIRNYIEEGGKYLGICAGAYFASDHIEFDKDGPMEVVGERDIKLFKGAAIGPVFPDYEYSSMKGSHAVEIVPVSQKEWPHSHFVYFNGGCSFKCDGTDAEVIYNYLETDEPAILKCKLGKGKGILSGVHFEFSPDLLQETNPNSRYVTSVIPMLLPDNNLRLQLTRKILQELDLKISSVW